MDIPTIENELIGWCRELGLSITSHVDDVFACGATSLTAIKLMNHIDGRFGDDALDVHTLYQCASIAQIAQVIHKNLPQGVLLRAKNPGDSGITLLDVTLRDGGYVNDHSWSSDEASTVLDACAAARIPYCEVGYFRPRMEGADDRWPTASCPLGFLKDLSEHQAGTRISVMAHARDVELSDYQSLAAHGVSVVRLPMRLPFPPGLADHVAAAKTAGLMVAVNLIRVSEVTTEDVAAAAIAAASYGADVFYLADSNGGLFPDDVAELVQAAAAGVDIPLGFHAHDGLSLAFINSLTALNSGCCYLDASMGGIGKGGGNLCLELIAGYLRSRRGSSLSVSQLVPAATTIATPWQLSVATRCESIASSLLNLNVEAIQTLQQPFPGDNTPALFNLLEQHTDTLSEKGVQNAAAIRR